MSFSLKDSGRKQTEALKKLARGRVVSVGIHEAEGSEAHKGAQKATVAEVGAFHEFGLGVPRRSFIADWFDQNLDQNKATLFQILQPCIQKPTYLDTALQRFAAWAVGQVQLRIASGIEPELAESTKRQKRKHGHAKDVPLIDTGQLRSSIRGKVSGA